MPAQTVPAATLVARMTMGTTTKSDEVTVVWQGEHLALVKKKGGSGWAGRGSRSYTPAYYEAVDTHHVGPMGTSAPDVITGRDLVPGGWLVNLPERGVISAYRWGASVGVKVAKERGFAVEDWIAHLTRLDTEYSHRRAAAKAEAKAKEEAKAAKAAAERVEFDRLARLVKAAPQMLMALKEAREALLGAAHDRHAEGSPALDSVNAAIAAAEEG